MKVFNGVTALSMIYALWGSTYFFSWFGVYDNAHDIQSFRDSVIFSIVPAAFLVAPLLFFVQGFVSTFALLHNKPDGEGITLKEGLFFVFKKLVRLTPFNLLILWYAIAFAPGSFAGPYWDTYVDKTIKPCTDGLWWTNVLFINNFYPAKFDDKCLGWTWFIPCFVQLSIALPFLLAINQAFPRKLATGVYSSLLVVFFALNAYLISHYNPGIFLTFDEGLYFSYGFLEELFMKPYFHFNSYLWGVMLSLAFLRYTQEKSTNVGLEEQSMTTKVFTKLRESAGMRYVLYVGVLITHVLIVFGLHGYIKDNGSWSTGQ
jgi:hypothetical protein